MMMVLSSPAGEKKTGTEFGGIQIPNSNVEDEVATYVRVLPRRHQKSSAVAPKLIGGKAKSFFNWRF